MKFQFDPSQTITSTFNRRKREPSDVQYLVGLHFLNYMGGSLSHEEICSYGEWVISDDGEYVLFETGGGSFEIPEMYEFKYRDQVIHLSSGGGGLRSKVFTQDESGIKNLQIFIDGFVVPKELSSEKETVAQKIAQAFVAQYESCRIEVIFHRDE
jgi:hypothetical protein